jgi:hypothetical protein
MQIIKRLRGVEHIEPIVTIEDSNVNNEKMATFAEVVNNQSSKKNNSDESDSKHGEQNKDYLCIVHINPPHISNTLYPLYAFGWDFGVYRFIYLYVGEPVSSIGFGGTKLKLKIEKKG